MFNTEGQRAKFKELVESILKNELPFIQRYEIEKTAFDRGLITAEQRVVTEETYNSQLISAISKFQDFDAEIFGS